jgi:serine/threonine-protein kinase
MTSRDDVMRAREIFYDLLSLPAPLREGEARRHCGDDETLRRLVLAYLSAVHDAEETDGSNPQIIVSPLQSLLSSPVSMPPPFLGPFAIEAVLGEGGMGVVYRARNKLTNQVVAIKTLRLGVHAASEARSRFVREIELQASVSDPRFVRLMHAEVYDTVLSLVMEYIEGEDLDRLVKRCGPLAPGEAVRLTIQAAEALQKLYEKGITHRDIKPKNIMRTAAGSVKLLDLGIARAHGSAAGSNELTEPQAALGTGPYMSPEQRSDPRQVDIRTDIYSLGLVLHVLLTGGLPGGDEPAPASGLPAIPEGLRPVIERMIAHDRDRRYREPIEVARDLSGWLPGSGDPAESRSASGPASSTAPSLPVLHDLAGTDVHDRLRTRFLWLSLGLLILAGTGWLAWPAAQRPPRAWAAVLTAIDNHLDSIDEPAVAARTRFVLAVPVAGLPAQDVSNQLRIRLMPSETRHAWTVLTPRGNDWQVVAVDLEAIGLSPQRWRLLHDDDPYGLSFGDNPVLGPLEKRINARTEGRRHGKTPMRADWLLAQLVRPPTTVNPTEGAVQVIQGYGKALDLDAAAGELGLSTRDFRSIVEGTMFRDDLEIRSLLEHGTVDRERWAGSRGRLFQRVAREFLGATPQD